MGKILIVSDNHGSSEVLFGVKEKETEADLLIHCGDSELTPDDPALKGFAAVKGNCDYFGDFPEELVLDHDGYRILVVHGHHYSVKNDLLKLAYRAEEVGANIVCFGHSHILGVEMIGSTLFINPGSLRLPRGRSEKTYVTLENCKNSVLLHVHDYDRGEMEKLKQKFSFEQ
ncbi:metallophosphoesterase [Mesobacillus zeae]|uniref:Phosphoesterase n=1 Tax=Mesobacillus zeae TaxID=1917180 RepID=A0A398B061_9BACI|nr:metallophosphoesterase [Mesobacillus zeae]RID83227.1 metallophosphoesterase [Mesobacillus zeae]